MKTTNNTNRACKLATALFAVIIFSATAMAQSQPDAGSATEVKEAFERLDALIASTEHDLRYVAPMDVNDDLRSVWERLELLAEKTEKEIQYRAPEDVQDSAVEFAETENAKEIDVQEWMTYNPASAKQDLNRMVFFITICRQ
jgi:hypothetical protein